MIDFDKAPEWAEFVMCPSEEAETKYWECSEKYQKIGGHSLHVNHPDTKDITRNWVRIPIVRQLEND